MSRMSPLLAAMACLTPCLLLEACASTHAQSTSAVSSEQTSMSQTVSGSFPLQTPAHIPAPHAVMQPLLPEIAPLASVASDAPASALASYVPVATATPVIPCQRFVSSLNAAENRLNAMGGGYQLHEL